MLVLELLISFFVLLEDILWSRLLSCLWQVQARQLKDTEKDLGRDLDQLKTQLEQQREERKEQERRVGVHTITITQ